MPTCWHTVWAFPQDFDTTSSSPLDLMSATSDAQCGLAPQNDAHEHGHASPQPFGTPAEHVNHQVTGRSTQCGPLQQHIAPVDIL